MYSDHGARPAANKALATGLILLCLSGVGQAQTSGTNVMTVPGTLYLTSHSNPMSLTNSVKIASGLRVGMAGADAQKYLEDHGMFQTNIYSISLDRGQTMICPYPLAGDAALVLGMHCTKAPPKGLFGWSVPVLDRAYIESQGATIILITLTNAP